MIMKHAIEWEVGWSDSAAAAPARFVPATVPGAVQLDWARAEGWPDHTYGENWREYGWMEDKYWVYRTRLQAPSPQEGERVAFVSGGIDYSFAIRLDGVELLKQEGMFTPVDMDLTDRYRPGAVLEVVVDPAPKRADAHRSRAEADHSVKPAVSYGWDWHPRLIPLGIWDETHLEIRPDVYLANAETFYDLNDGLDAAELRLDVELNRYAAGALTWRLTDPDGESVFERTVDTTDKRISLHATIDRPRLWWPHDQGPQPLYLSEVSWTDGSRSDSASTRRLQRIGFRRVRLTMHEGAWREPVGFPKSRSHPPITLEVNGRNVFGKGTNWVNPDIFPGTITAERYRTLLELAKDAHMNLLRVWGGGIVNKESFFEQCDEMGIMVWQEFPLACNLYPDKPDYLRVLDQESRSIVSRLRKHPSLVLWCGGNELFNSWSRMTDQSLPLRLLNANCYALDPKTPFLMTSPVEGMGHGNYVFRYQNGEDVLQAMPKANNTAYTEFGVPSPSPVELLKRFIPPEELFPPKPGTSWESHHAFNAWVGETWLMPRLIEDYFGPSETLEQLVERGQLLQSEGYKCIFEEARRQKPRCSMALNWCYNEPWPTAANNSIVCWPAEPKPAYYAVQSSNRPVLASARIPKFEWKEGDWFEPELWLLNDSPATVPGGRMAAYLDLGTGGRHLLLAWDVPETGPNENRRGPTARFRIPAASDERMKLELVMPDAPERDSVYTLLFTSENRPAPQPRSVLNL
ncbi:hypothetical protein FE782_05105 [Paenibacillus antri]|uniref:beta-mannosidase n=1 Tax=Paenibacillus antri TaxID=2582848 RepID=A0A5R9GB11_9BACL|nr:hypothetical protein [Paenibacillus antri]TLS53652.1 hypothetical protein FE782_05105 [Paenibacillus antri]